MGILGVENIIDVMVTYCMLQNNCPAYRKPRPFSPQIVKLIVTSTTLVLTMGIPNICSRMSFFTGKPQCTHLKFLA